MRLCFSFVCLKWFIFSYVHAKVIRLWGGRLIGCFSAVSLSKLNFEVMAVLDKCSHTRNTVALGGAVLISRATNEWDSTRGSRALEELRRDYVHFSACYLLFYR